MLFDPETAEIVALAGAALGALGIGVAVAANLRVARIRRAYSVLQGRGGDTDFVTAVNRQIATVDALRAEIAELRGGLDRARSDLSDALRHVAVVRYDAFPDMGGRLSFSIALLDDAGDGLVLTSINGRSETRTYAKGVKSGASEQQLSPEEAQAVQHATRTLARR